MNPFHMLRQRVMLLLIGAAMLVGSWAVWNKPDEPFAQWLYPTWFAVAGLLTLGFALWPGSEFLFRFSGALVITAWGSRAAALLVQGVVNGFDPLDYGRIVGFVGYMLAAGALWEVWRVTFRPWHNLNEARSEKGLR